MDRDAIVHPSEVKGTWFVTLRSWGEQELGESLESIAAEMPRYGELVAQSEQRDWYPEEALHELFEVLFIRAGSPERFVEMSRSVSREGVGRFFRALLGLSSARFLLKQVPTMWGRLRRHDGAVVRVESHPDHSIVRYSNFPWFRYAVYRHFTLGSLSALAQLAEASAGKVGLVDHRDDAVTVRVEHP